MSEIAADFKGALIKKSPFRPDGVSLGLMSVHENGQNHQLDWARRNRTGVAEAVFCSAKSAAQIEAILSSYDRQGQAALLTRLAAAKFSALASTWQDRLDFDLQSETAIFGSLPKPQSAADIAIVTAGTSDEAVAREAARTLAFHGHASQVYEDRGVAGLWRVQAIEEELASYRIVIAVAGMEGALFSVLAGLLPSVVIAVPVAGGYVGIGGDGQAALQSALSACAPGIVTVNINNGYGAANAAIKILAKMQGSARHG